jgi:hypothetical protein
MTRTKVGAALIALGAACFAATSASAGIVCNEDGDCWHTATVYEYNPQWRLTVHPDDWVWRQGNYRWREHEGRGYWRGGVWVGF